MCDTFGNTEERIESIDTKHNKTHELTIELSVISVLYKAKQPSYSYILKGYIRRNPSSDKTSLVSLFSCSLNSVLIVASYMLWDIFYDFGSS